MDYEKAKQEYVSAQDELDDATAKYEKIEEKIYATGILISYYEALAENSGNISFSLTKSKDILDEEFKFDDLDDAADEIENMNTTVTDTEENIEDIKSGLQTIMDELNEDLVAQQKIVSSLKTKRDNAYAVYQAWSAVQY